MGRKQKWFFYWTKHGYFCPDRMIFTFHQKVSKALNKTQPPSQILMKIKYYSYYKKIFRQKKKHDIILLVSQSYYSKIEAQSCVINLVKRLDFPDKK